MKHPRMLVFVAAVAASCGALANANVAQVICADGAKHVMRLTQVEPGTLNAVEAKSLQLGPNESVWVRLPAGSTLAQL